MTKPNKPNKRGRGSEGSGLKVDKKKSREGETEPEPENIPLDDTRGSEIFEDTVGEDGEQSGLEDEVVKQIGLNETRKNKLKWH